MVVLDVVAFRCEAPDFIRPKTSQERGLVCQLAENGTQFVCFARMFCVGCEQAHDAAIDPNDARAQNRAFNGNAASRIRSGTCNGQLCDFGPDSVPSAIFPLFHR